MAAEIADFETPWFQSLKLMVDAAGVTFEDEFVPVEGAQMNQEISDRVIKVRFTLKIYGFGQKWPKYDV